MRSARTLKADAVHRIRELKGKIEIDDFSGELRRDREL